MTEAFMPDVLSFIMSYLQLNEFLDTNEDVLEAIGQSALDTVDANLEWLNKYGEEISIWLRPDGPDTTTDGTETTTDGTETTTPDGSGNIATNTIVITIAFIITLLHSTQIFN
jgi:hypothetical protein